MRWCTNPKYVKLNVHAMSCFINWLHYCVLQSEAFLWFLNDYIASHQVTFPEQEIDQIQTHFVKSRGRNHIVFRVDPVV